MPSTRRSASLLGRMWLIFDTIVFDMTETKIALFKGKKVRRIIYNNEWWFSVVDVIEVLTDSNKPRVYWHAMKVRVRDEDGIELSTNCRQLKLISSDGKKYSLY